jgi:hypothetical protein
MDNYTHNFVDLPDDIWIDIVKLAKKTNADIVKSMNLNELIELEKLVNNRRSELQNDADHFHVIQTTAVRALTALISATLTTAANART